MTATKSKPITVALNTLRLSPTNVRQEPGDITTLAQSIRSFGLLNPLLVTFNRVHWAVEAGGRRLAALQKLHADGHIGAEEQIPCIVFDTPDAARSLAENHERQPMDVVQQFQAFAKLIGDGRTAHEVAEMFSVTPQFVRQRVKLAELVPEVLVAYRQGRLNLEQMAALTWGTAEQQRTIVADPRPPGAFELRARLRGSTTPRDNWRVVFVGMDAYTAAGGRTTEDLFACTADLIDPDLLDQLVEDKLQATADKMRAQGAAFAEPISISDLNKPNNGYCDPPTRWSLSAEQQGHYDKLYDKLTELKENEVDEDDPKYPALLQEIEQIEEELNNIERSAIKRVGDHPVGLLVAVSYDGQLTTREVCRIADVRAAREKVQAAASPDTDAAEAPPASNPIPAGREDLTSRGTIEIAQARQAGLALKVATDTQLALALVAQSWDFAIFGPAYDRYEGNASLGREQPWERPNPWVGYPRRCPSPRPAELAQRLADITDSGAKQRRASFRATQTTVIPLSWYIEQPKSVLLYILAHAVATALCDPDSSERGIEVTSRCRNTLADLIDATGFELTDVWKPTAEWLKGYGKKKTLEALSSVNSITPELSKAKAAELYEAAAPILAQLNWVPEYGLAGALRGAANG